MFCNASFVKILSYKKYLILDWGEPCVCLFFGVLVWTSHFLEISNECIQIVHEIEQLQQLSESMHHVNDYCQNCIVSQNDLFTV